MELINLVTGILFHLDSYFDTLIRNYGFWTYGILFLIIFLETGLVVTPFLPGDSLLFAGGTFSALGSLDAGLLIAFLSAAAISGDTVNYWAGAMIGTRVLNQKRFRLINREHLYRTQRFYEKYGGKTIVLARFIPIIRTFAPFVAGIGSMTYGRFLVYNVLGGVIWVVSFTLVGYFFGNIPAVRNNFFLVILAIIIVSVLPGVIEFLRSRHDV